MVELVDTPDLGSGASRRVGSSPIRRTKVDKRIFFREDSLVLFMVLSYIHAIIYGYSMGIPYTLETFIIASIIE